LTNPILVAVVNESTMLHDTAVSNVVAHLQTQIKRDFTPIWGIAADVWFYPSGSVVPANAWQMVVLDNSDQAGALGYHELTATGQPLAKIFVKDTVGAGDAWSVTMSHELCEMLVDPNTNLTVFNQTTNTAGELIVYETCDPVEDDQYGYAIGSIRVSDFVTPNYFIPGSTGPWDFGKHLTAPLQIITGGYLAVFNVNSGSGWTQIFGKKNSGWKQYTRSKDGKLIKSDVDANDKRFIPRSEWKTSLK